MGDMTVTQMEATTEAEQVQGMVVGDGATTVQAEGTETPGLRLGETRREAEGTLTTKQGPTRSQRLGEAEAELSTQ